MRPNLCVWSNSLVRVYSSWDFTSWAKTQQHLCCALIPALALTELAVSGEAIYISALMVIACTTLAEISLFGMVVAFLIVVGMQKR